MTSKQHMMKMILFAEFALIWIFAFHVRACGPTADWFRNAAEEGQQPVKSYHHVVDRLAFWQYYRPYIQGKILLRDGQYSAAIAHYRQWAEQLRQQGRGRILNGVGLWALRGINLRLLVLETTQENPTERTIALAVCSALDAEDHVEAEKLASNLPQNDLGKYLRYYLRNPRDAEQAEALLNQLPTESPVRPLLMYRAIRYGESPSRVLELSELFLRDCPEHYLADDVLGWKARTLLQQGNKEDALTAYLDLLMKYPDSDLVNAVIESIVGIHVSHYRGGGDWERCRILSYIEALSRERLTLEGPERLLRLLATCEQSTQAHALVPEILAAVVKAGRKPRFWENGDGTEKPWGYDLTAGSEQALLRLAREFPWQRDATWLAVKDLPEDTLTATELLELLRYSIDPVWNRKLMRRYLGALGKNAEKDAQKHAVRENLLPELPAGPSFFEQLTAWDLLDQTGTAPYARPELLTYASDILTSLDSVPMLEEERRLYLMLQLRVEAARGAEDKFRETRDQLLKLGMNELEQSELAMLDGAVALKTGKDDAMLTDIVRNEQHPYRTTAGRLLARHAVETKDYTKLLWVSSQCNVYDAFAMAFANVAPDDLDRMLASPSSDYNDVRRQLFLRRALWAVLERDLDWLSPRETQLADYCREWPQWLPEMVTKIRNAEHAIAQAKTHHARKMAEYAMATATYGVKKQADLSYDCYRRLKALEKSLPDSETQLRAKCLYTMATSLQNLNDANVSHMYYSFESIHLGMAWFGQNEDLMKWSRSRKIFLEIADLYQRVADECPETTLADDALYWAAFNCDLYCRSPWRWQTTDRDPPEEDVKARAQTLRQRIRDDYPHSDSFKRLPNQLQ